MNQIVSDRNFVFDSIMPNWILDVETQAVIIAGLSCVGAWVIFQWIIQIVFSVLWPFFAIAGIMILMPSWRKSFAKECLPRHLRVLKNWSNKIIGFNSSYTS